MAESRYDQVVEALRVRLGEPAPGLIQFLVGPRQVGKTTALLELAREAGEAAQYVACDAAEAAIPGAWERWWSDAEVRAHSQRPALLLLDEIQHVPDWAARLKAVWDRLRRESIKVQVIVSGSSALRLGAEANESLAGRFERTTLTHWSASSLAAAFGLEPEVAVRELVLRGGYPGTVRFRDDPARWVAYVRDAIIEPAIGRDILALGAVRRPALLRQVFALAVSSPAQIVSLQKLQGQLQDRGALETVAHYLELLQEAYLVAALPKYAATEIRRRSAPPKLVVLNNALMAAGDPRGAPEPTRDPARFGVWVENACIAHAINAGQQVSYWRREPHEVDAVIEGNWGRLAIEVKTGPHGIEDLRGLATFIEAFPGFEPLVLCDAELSEPAQRLGLSSMPWREWLLRGPA